VVFVSVRGRDASVPRTRRKRALGVADGTTWEAFTALVCQRLALRGVAGVYHAATGAVLRSLEDLQDIEDLEVEARGLRAGGGGRVSPATRAGDGGGVQRPPWGGARDAPQGERRGGSVAGRGGQEVRAKRCGGWHAGEECPRR